MTPQSRTFAHTCTCTDPAALGFSANAKIQINQKCYSAADGRRNQMPALCDGRLLGGELTFSGSSEKLLDI